MGTSFHFLFNYHNITLSKSLRVLDRKLPLARNVEVAELHSAWLLCKNWHPAACLQIYASLDLQFSNILYYMGVSQI